MLRPGGNRNCLRLPSPWHTGASRSGGIRREEQKAAAPSHSHNLFLMPVPLLRTCVRDINTATLASLHSLLNETCTKALEVCWPGLRQLQSIPWVPMRENVIWGGGGWKPKSKSLVWVCTHRLPHPIPQNHWESLISSPRKKKGWKPSRKRQPSFPWYWRSLPRAPSISIALTYTFHNSPTLIMPLFSESPKWSFFLKSVYYEQIMLKAFEVPECFAEVLMYGPYTGT